MDYKDKYSKYKNKYMKLCIKLGGGGKKLKNNLYDKDKHKDKDKRMSKKYVENVSEPWFTLISLGLKTIEGRKNKGRFEEMEVGDIIDWNNKDFNPRNVLTKITKKTVYNTFQEYLEKEGLQKCLPGINTIEDGLSVYFKYFTEEDEKKYGVVAIGLELI